MGSLNAFHLTLIIIACLCFIKLASKPRETLKIVYTFGWFVQDTVYAVLAWFQPKAPVAPIRTPQPLPIGVPVVPALPPVVAQERIKMDTQPIAPTYSAAAIPSTIKGVVDGMRQTNKLPYLVPLVWTKEETGYHCWNVHLTAEPDQAIGETNHISVTGVKNTGKDSFLLQAALCLATQHTPEELQFYVIDGKGDLILLSKLKHTVSCAVDETQIPTVLELLSLERKRRQDVINQASLNDIRTYKWETLPTEVKVKEGMTALVVVFISEILLLRGMYSSTKEFETKITELLVACRSAGIRIFVSGQSFVNLGTTWRGQMDIRGSSALSTSTDDDANLGLSGQAIIDLEAVPPSKFDPTKDKGRFTFIQGGGQVGVTGLSAYISSEEIRNAILQLPQREEAAIAKVEDEKKKVSDEDIIAYFTANPKATQSEAEQALFGFTGGTAWQAVRRVRQQLDVDKK